MPILESLGTVVLDCLDPAELAAFYGKATDWEVTYSDDDVVYLGNGASTQIALQRIEGYRAPSWPDGTKHAHLDFTVADPDRAVDELLALGASRPEFQPGDGQWVVLVDPAGHPFCVAAGG
ncbi:VOC family protein [Embleya sp. AB8]|uniref:VOC family protein n=1 Tax=Embleya sp. AB8 TaxID=3156304 RepID=UPI003C72A5B8